MTKDIVGKRFKSNNGGWFTVLRKTERNQGTNFLYEIQFDETNGVKYKTLANKQHIKNGSVKNGFYSSVHGIGYLGNAIRKGNELIYSRWQGMLSRCYNLKSKKFKTYGARGVSVCDRWLCFEHFLHDFPLLDGYDENNIENLELDKDIKISNNKIYSPKTCILVSQAENTAERTERNNKKFIATSPDGKVYKSNNQTKFAEKHNLNFNGIYGCLRHKQKTHS